MKMRRHVTQMLHELTKLQTSFDPLRIKWITANKNKHGGLNLHMNTMNVIGSQSPHIAEDGILYAPRHPLHGKKFLPPHTLPSNIGIVVRPKGAMAGWGIEDGVCVQTIGATIEGIYDDPSLMPYASTILQKVSHRSIIQNTWYYPSPPSPDASAHRRLEYHALIQERRQMMGGINPKIIGLLEKMGPKITVARNEDVVVLCKQRYKNIIPLYSLGSMRKKSTPIQNSI